MNRPNLSNVIRNEDEQISGLDIDIKIISNNTELEWRRVGTEDWHRLDRKDHLQMTKGHDTPTVLWEILKELAERGGIIKRQEVSPAVWDRLLRYKERLEKKLQAGLGIKKPLFGKRMKNCIKLLVHSISQQHGNPAEISQTDIEPETYRLELGEADVTAPSPRSPLSSFRRRTSK